MALAFRTDLASAGRGVGATAIFAVIYAGRGVLVGAVRKGDKVVKPTGGLRIEDGDQIVLFSLSGDVPEVERLLQQRIKTQPHMKTAGSCFKAVGSTPAWKLIDAAGLRGRQQGGVSVSEKHANFLINEGEATFEDAVSMVKHVRTHVNDPLEVEMRFYDTDGKLRELV